MQPQQAHKHGEITFVLEAPPLRVCLAAEALAVAVKELKLSQEAAAKAHSSAEAAARQADKLTHKLANMPKVWPPQHREEMT